MKRLLLLMVFMVPILMASRSPIKYNLYQIKVWYLVATEGFEPYWYRDGTGKNGQPAYSIGCGYNDWATKERRWEIAQYLRDGLTLNEGVEISLKELDKYKVKCSDRYTELAYRFYAYNTGKIPSAVEDLAGCCKSKIGCGNPNKNVIKSHTKKRKFEYALATHDFSTVMEMLEGFKSDKIRIEQRTKK